MAYLKWTAGRPMASRGPKRPRQLGQRRLKVGLASGVFCEDDPSEMALMMRAMTRVQVVHAIENGETDVEAVSDRLVSRILRMVCRDGIQAREVG